jgi:phosphoribosylformylglycinamidine cyclo-ligase
MDYKKSGVDREGAASWIQDLKNPIQQSFRAEILSSIGGFGAMFESPSSYRQPAWVATTDGVGTKLLLAEEAGDAAFFAMGVDAVAMCVNDLLACRAEPIAFLDYLAIDSLAKERMDFLLKGIIEGCRQSGCSLIGGETAEMPGFYPRGRLDVAGFAVGVLEKDQIWRNKVARENLVLVGLASHGFHSNGFSLIRKVMSEQGWTLDSQIEGQTLGDYLLKPTKIYVKECLNLLRSPSVFGAAHITGGGFIENIPRFLEPGYRAVIRRESFESSSMMKAFAHAAKIDSAEVFSTWNMGIGFVFACEERLVEQVQRDIKDAFVIGHVERSSEVEMITIL